MRPYATGKGNHQPIVRLICTELSLIERWRAEKPCRGVPMFYTETADGVIVYPMPEDGWWVIDADKDGEEMAVL